MDATIDQYFDCFCRTCMHNLTETSFDVNITSEQQWKSVADPIEECGTMDIAELLSIAVPKIQVQLNDELPKKMCHECLQKLLSFHRFQKMCQQSDRDIRELIVRRKAQFEITTKIQVEDKVETNFPDLLKSNDGAISETPHNFQGLFFNLQHQQDFETKDAKTELEFVSSLPHAEQLNAVDPLHSNDDLMENVNVSQAGAIEFAKREQCDDKDISDYTNSETLCSRYFYKAEAFRNHRLAHDSKTRNNIVLTACDLCDRTYSSKRTLARHKRMRHASETSQKTLKQHACDLCAKSFKNSVALRDHIRTHTGERPYLCPECGKSYSTSGNLRQHRLRHRTDKPYECPNCPMRFPCSSGLTNHKRIHAAKQHTCDICAARFAKSDDLKRHKMHHLGEKPYKCEYCEMRFVRMNHQRRHMRTHTGEKPYKCKYCERAFAQSNDHIKHLRTHLGDNVYRCELCPLAYRLASELRLHFATHKEDNEVTRQRNMKALMEAEAELESKITSKSNSTVF